MSDPDASKPENIEWQGKFITTKTRGRWEYVSRARGIKAAAIIAIDDGHVILVEQYRVPLGKICLEIPAGLIGDDEGKAGEAAEDAAKRELEEETGIPAEAVEVLAEASLHIGGDAGEDDVGDAALAQHQLEVGGAEGALAGLVDDRLAVDDLAGIARRWFVAGGEAGCGARIQIARVDEFGDGILTNFCYAKAACGWNSPLHYSETPICRAHQFACRGGCLAYSLSSIPVSAPMVGELHTLH